MCVRDGGGMCVRDGGGAIGISLSKKGALAKKRLRNTDITTALP